MPKNNELYQMAIDYVVNLPYSRFLGLKFEYARDDEQVFSVNWQPGIVGNAVQHTMHHSVLTTLVDVAGGAAVAACLSEPHAVVTLDLRMDFLAALPNQAEECCFAHAKCHSLCDHIASVRTVCFCPPQTQPVVYATATYVCTPLSEEKKAKFL